MSDENIIHAFPGAELPENLLTVAPRPSAVPTFCQHEAIRLDPYDRTVQCARCGQTLDPFSFLHENARTLAMAWENHRYAKSKVDELQERILFLKKEEKRLAAKVRRLAAKTDDVIVDRSKPL